MTLVSNKPSQKNPHTYVVTVIGANADSPGCKAQSSSDGSQFLVLLSVAGAAARPVTVFLRWDLRLL
jgi:hypothetical protein